MSLSSGDLAAQLADLDAERHTPWMAITRDQELWGMALWVEKHHGPDGWFYIAQQQDRLLALGDLDGLAMWKEVGRRLECLTPPSTSN